MKDMFKRFAISAYAWFKPDCKAKIVYYHDVGQQVTEMGTPSELFWTHVATACKAGWTYVKSPDELEEGDMRVMTCFDDGFSGIWSERDRFVQQGIFPTVFLAVDLVGKPRYLDWRQVSELQRLGFRFQGHGWSHDRFTDHLDDEKALWHEIRDSKLELECHLCSPVEEVCFPVGMYSQKIVSMCRQAGYKRMYTSDEGSVTQGDDLLPRNLVQGLDARSFLAVLRGGANFLRHKHCRMHVLREGEIV